MSEVASPRSTIAIAHLVWGPLGPAPLRRFLASYRQFPAGEAHELVVLFNGVGEGRRPELEAELEGIEHRVLVLDPPVQDIAAYAYAAKRLQHERICFLNSYSVLLAPDWLAKLSTALDQPRVGLVGATGSWASMRSAVLNALMLPNPYRRAVPKRSVTREQVVSIALDLERESSSDCLEEVAAPDAHVPRAGARSLLGRGLRLLKDLSPMPEQLLRFDGFPSHHLRTNAFMLDRATFNSLNVRQINRKMDAYLMESGRHSFTRQVQRRGLRTLVVARDGSAYDHEQWPCSHTLWQGDQEGLLIADNQTRSYESGDIDRRRVLSAFAWGPQANPRTPAGRR
jgi:hypothetical protein